MMPSLQAYQDGESSILSEYASAIFYLSSLLCL